jgi:NTE family protein
VLIGPYILKTQGMRWTKDKWGKEGEISVDAQYSLWDGGVYDNLGLEALHKIGRGLDDEVDFLFVSNASPLISYKERQGNVSLANFMRLLDIAISQVDSLRTQEVYESVISKGNGMYLQIGNSAEKIAEAFRIPPDEAGPLVESCLSEEETAMVRDYATTLRTPSPENFERIFRHGYENAKCVHLFREISGGFSFC